MKALRSLLNRFRDAVRGMWVRPDAVVGQEQPLTLQNLMNRTGGKLQQVVDEAMSTAVADIKQRPRVAGCRVVIVEIHIRTQSDTGLLAVEIQTATGMPSDPELN